jgi:hypothetical protein
VKDIFWNKKKILSHGDVFVGPHASTDAKDIFLQLQKEKMIFLVVMSSKCQGGGLHDLWSKTTKATQQHHDEIYIVA